MTFDDLQRLTRGISRLNYKDFDRVLETSIGSGTSYSRFCWLRFQDNPVGYITTREPAIQGQKLMELAWQRGEES